MSLKMETQEPSVSEDFFSADDYVINIIKRAVKNSQNIHISLAGKGNVVIHSTEGEYYDHTDNIEEFCTSASSKFKVTVLDKKDLAADSSDHGRNIDELMWLAGFYASKGRLMQGCTRSDVVELMHWPNLTRLPSTENTMRIASLLSSHPTSITLAQRLLKIEDSEIYQFYSAARCAGLVRAVNRTPEEPSLKPHRNQALLGLLLNKIARI